jgi:putative transposase
MDRVIQQSRGGSSSALRLRIRDLAHARPCFGYLRIWVLLRREGWSINRKRGRRLSPRARPRS